MARKSKKMLSYYAWYRKIRTPKFKSVARFKGNKILTSDPVFISKVQDASTMKLEYAPILGHIGLQYTIVNEVSNEVVAKVDKALNVYTVDEKYVGTIYNQFKIITRIIFYLLLLALLIALGIGNLHSTGYLVKPENVIISEHDGGIVVDKWNILLDAYNRKLIVPEYESAYHFNVLNDNYADCYIAFDFDEVNEWDLNIEFRLYYDGEYLVGGNDSWVNYDELKASNILIKAKEKEKFRLDWRWTDTDEVQTEIGTEGVATYTVIVKITTQYVN